MQTANSISSRLNDHIVPSDSVKNFGVYFDKDLSMKTHIKKLLQMSFASLKKIRSIKSYLNQESLKKIVSALILSRIEYGNIALMRLPKLQTKKIRKPNQYQEVGSLMTTSAIKYLQWLQIEE